jgi:hypothetical protein
MHKIFSLAAALLMATSPLLSQGKWTDLMFHYQTGTVPPPYFYQYNININSGGSAVLVYFPGYSIDTSWAYKFDVSEIDIKRLDDSIASSKILTEPILSMPEHKHPIGGSIESLTVVLWEDPALDQRPPTLVVPDFPQPQFKEAIDNLYSTIKSLAPQTIWDEISKRKEEYIKK